MTTKNFIPSQYDPVFDPPRPSPIIIGSFNVVGEKQEYSHSFNCKYVYNRMNSRSLSYDLNAGMDAVIRRKEPENIDHLLNYIKKMFEKLRNTTDTYKKKSLKADFVCRRSLLLTLMNAAYDTREPWIVLATKFRGTIYLCAKLTNEKRREIASRYSWHWQPLSFEYKFRQYILSDDPNKPPKTDVPVNENEELVCMFESKWERKELLYGAEMVGIESDIVIDLINANPNKLNFVLTKVSEGPLSSDKEVRFNTSYRRWWCESALTNVSRIILGNSEGGTVKSVSQFDLNELLMLHETEWSSTNCYKACDGFLEFVKDSMWHVDCPHTVYQFEYDPRSAPYVRVKGFPDKENDLRFLPKWYYEHIASLITEYP